LLPDYNVESTLPILSSVSIAPDNVYVKLHNLDPNKSAGPDNWPTKVHQEMAEQLCLPITNLFTKLLHYLMCEKEDISVHKKVTISILKTTVT